MNDQEKAAKLASALAAGVSANRVSGNKNSYRKDNPGEYAKVIAYLDGGPRPTGTLTKMGQFIVEVEDVRIASLRYEPEHIVTGTHFVNTTDYDELAGIGYEFAIVTVAPADIAGATAHLDAAAAQGMKCIIGLYHYGGAQPYTYTGGVWGLTANTTTMLNFLESREDDIIAFFGFNEPYWIDPFTETTNPDGAVPAQQLRDFRTTIQGVWPTVKIFHDIGEPSAWAPGGSVWTPGIGNKFADQSEVADYVGMWRYCFTDSGYLKSESLAILDTEVPFCQEEIGAIPVWDSQSLAQASLDFVMPDATDIADYNSAIRQALPPEALISWYVWRFSGLYDDYLVNHPELWEYTV